MKKLAKHDVIVLILTLIVDVLFSIISLQFFGKELSGMFIFTIIGWVMINFAIFVYLIVSMIVLPLANIKSCDKVQKEENIINLVRSKAKVVMGFLIPHTLVSIVVFGFIFSLSISMLGEFLLGALILMFIFPFNLCILALGISALAILVYLIVPILSIVFYIVPLGIEIIMISIYLKMIKQISVLQLILFILFAFIPVVNLGIVIYMYNKAKKPIVLEG